MSATIALLTDFGIEDTYVGVMKGVIRGIAPNAAIVDLTHHVPPQDVRAGAFHLLVSYRYFPADTVFCVVVDPGVGTARRPIAAALRTPNGTRYTFVLPDNGLLTPLLDENHLEQVLVLDNPRYHLPNVSHTFHGRDIFAPVAAHLAAGVPLADVGTPLASDAMVRLEWPHPEPHAGGWVATIIHADHFGNLITNLRAEDLQPDMQKWLVVAGPVQIQGISRTFGDVPPGMPVAYIGSSGFLELAVRQGNARRQWGVGPGARVQVARIGGKASV